MNLLVTILILFWLKVLTVQGKICFSEPWKYRKVLYCFKILNDGVSTSSIREKKWAMSLEHRSLASGREAFAICKKCVFNFVQFNIILHLLCLWFGPGTRLDFAEIPRKRGSATKPSLGECQFLMFWTRCDKGSRQKKSENFTVRLTVSIIPATHLTASLTVKCSLFWWLPLFFWQIEDGSHLRRWTRARTGGCARKCPRSQSNNHRPVSDKKIMMITLIMILMEFKRMIITTGK